MDAFQILVLALVQGFTEYLPISSSAHLILSPYLFGFQDQGLAFDVAVHFGSLLAVIGYFRRDITAILKDWFGNVLYKREATDNSRLGWAVIIGTIPVVIGGLLMQTLVEGELRSPLVIAIATIMFGLLLWWADVRSRRYRHIDNLGIVDVIFIGCMQVVALIPGTSRSGITMTAGLMLGLTREAAARFSFLLAVPTILMSATLVTAELLMDAAPVDWRSLGLGVLLSWAAAFVCIQVFLRYIERTGMLPFVIYRLLLGAVILWLEFVH
jgi:undecaprenyl-diphosphatase